MKDLLQALLNIADKKVDIDLDSGWSQGSKTYLDALGDELKEVREEIDQQRLCYLEDELADILWVYACALKHLERETHLSSERVLQRANDKYQQRVTSILQDIPWDEVKKEQKQQLKQEFGHEQALKRPFYRPNKDQ